MLIIKLFNTAFCKLQTLNSEMQNRWSVSRDKLVLPLRIRSGRNFLCKKRIFFWNEVLIEIINRLFHIIYVSQEAVHSFLLEYVYKFASDLYDFIMFHWLRKPLRFRHDHMKPFFVKYGGSILHVENWASSFWKTWCHMIMTNYEFRYSCIQIFFI